MHARALAEHVLGMTDRPALFDGFTAQDMAEHAAEYPAGTPGAEPQILDFSHQDAFIAHVHGMPVGQIRWTFEQDKRVYSDDEAVADAAKGDHNGYYLRVSDLVVDEAFRGRGIGRLLWERFRGHAEHHHGADGWDPGTFTADGAAFWKAVTGTEVPATARISMGGDS